jgi:hypothetical protein
MRNILDKRRTEKQNLHFMFNHFSENGAIMRLCPKIWWSQKGHK